MKGTAEERLAWLDQLYPTWEEHTLWTRFAENVKKYRDRIFLICQDQSYTYEDIKIGADHMARSLYALGVRPGDHVAVFLYNSPEYLYMIFALAKLGAVKIPVNMKLGDEEKAYVLRQSDASWAVGTKLPPEEILREIPALKGWVRADRWKEFWNFGEGISEELVEQTEQESRDPKGVCDIMYTSGSTSFPKGVMLTHDMILRSSFGSCRTRLMEEGRRMFIPIPFYHIFAYNEGIMTMLHVGGTMVISENKFDPVTSLELMKKHQVHDIICVSIVMIEILERGKPKPEDYPHLHAAYWASTCPEWVWDAGKKAFGITDVTTGYGMTECGSTSTLMSPLAPSDQVKHYVGKLKDGGVAGMNGTGSLIQLKICDPDTGEEVLTGKPGEILCRGLTVTPGYYRNPEANQKAFTEDGWFHTGDLGWFQEDGLLTFCGRTNDTYKINGENVSPQFLDQMIGKCPLVEQVEVVGIRHDRYGEAGVAFVDVKEDTPQSRQEIENYCRQTLARFQVPKYFIYENSERWPRTATGKVQKGKLRERAQELVAVL